MLEKVVKGKIIKGIAGFYYVHVADDGIYHGIYECKAKGIFRKENIKPLVGDDVKIEVAGGGKFEGNIMEILPRRSELIRPAVANIDQALLIFAINKPAPNYNLLDRFLIMMRQQGLKCIICFNKNDISGEDERREIADIYKDSECRVLFVSALENEGVEELMEVLRGKTTAVAGPSGVGKSSIVNRLQSGVEMETGDISAKIDRGKHTTRHSQLITISDNTYIMDTPGFSSLSLFDMEKEELKDFYPEFAKYENQCKFLTCTHIHEPVCGVRKALDEGKISKVRYDNYVTMYDELRELEKRKY